MLVQPASQKSEIKLCAYIILHGETQTFSRSNNFVFEWKAQISCVRSCLGFLLVKPLSKFGLFNEINSPGQDVGCEFMIFLGEWRHFSAYIIFFFLTSYLFIPPPPCMCFAVRVCWSSPSCQKMKMCFSW